MAGTSETVRPSASSSRTSGGAPSREVPPPGAWGRNSAESALMSRNERTGFPFTAAMASPRRRPAFAAGLPGSTAAM